MADRDSAAVDTGCQPQDQSAAETIQRLEQQLIAMERLATVGELAGTITHEFNNVLMTVINYANLGLRQKDAATRDKAFQKIFDAANRASKICNTVLAVSKSATAATGACDVAATVRDSLVLMERELQKYRIHVELQLESVPTAAIAAPQLQRVLINLVTNARQAIGQAGSMSLKTSYDAADGRVVLMVRDSGPGIPPEILPRIFEKFFTTKNGPDASGKGGTGLGLAMCREIVEQVGGRIRVETAIGKGTAFVLRLPVAKASSAASGGSESSQPPAPGRSDAWPRSA